MPRLIAKYGGRGGSCSDGLDTMTSLRSTTSHGASPRRDNQSRKPAYSIADRRVSQTILLLSGARASSDTRSESVQISIQLGAPNSSATHFARTCGSDELMGPKLRSSYVVITGSDRPAFRRA